MAIGFLPNLWPLYAEFLLQCFVHFGWSPDSAGLAPVSVLAGLMPTHFSLALYVLTETRVGYHHGSKQESGILLALAMFQGSSGNM